MCFLDKSSKQTHHLLCAFRKSKVGRRQMLLFTNPLPSEKQFKDRNSKNLIFVLGQENSKMFLRKISKTLNYKAWKCKDFDDIGLPVGSQKLIDTLFLFIPNL